MRIKNKGILKKTHSIKIKRKDRRVTFIGIQEKVHKTPPAVRSQQLAQQPNKETRKLLVPSLRIPMVCSNDTQRSTPPQIVLLGKQHQKNEIMSTSNKPNNSQLIQSSNKFRGFIIPQLNGPMTAQLSAR